MDSVCASMSPISALARGAQLPAGYTHDRGGDGQQVVDSRRIIRERGAGQIVALADGVAAHALDELLQRRQELRLLDVPQDLVEHEVPAMVGSIGGDEDRRAGPVLVTRRPRGRAAAVKAR